MKFGVNKIITLILLFVYNLVYTDFRNTFPQILKKTYIMQHIIQNNGMLTADLSQRQAARSHIDPYSVKAVFKRHGIAADKKLAKYLITGKMQLQGLTGIAFVKGGHHFLYGIAHQMAGHADNAAGAQRKKGQGQAVITAVYLKIRSHACFDLAGLFQITGSFFNCNDIFYLGKPDSGGCLQINACT